MNKKLTYAVICTFGAALLFLTALLFFLPRSEYSYAERRRLAEPPTLTGRTLFSGEYMGDAEDYLLDQFPFRDGFRRLNAFLKLKVFRQMDSNGLYVVKGGIYKLETPLSQKQVLYTANKINDIREKYLAGLNVYYSVIPDKSQFVAAENGYPAFDLEGLLELMRENVNAGYIDIIHCLSEEDYYKTDTHWRQERLIGVADTLLAGMKNSASAAKEQFTENMLYPFWGVYSGQLALKTEADSLTYLSSPVIEGCAVKILGTEGAQSVYYPEEFSGADGYDVFLSGAESLIEITNPAAESDRELIIFRDSFSSSLAPLLLSGYSRITLVDLRYFSSELLAEYIEFSGQDVLFLFSTQLINSGMLLK